MTWSERPSAVPSSEEGGDAACWLANVCARCGAFNELPSAPCWRCGAAAEELIREPHRDGARMRIVRMLLTSDGVPASGPIHDTLLHLLGKPIAEAHLVVVIDAILPFPGDKSKLLENLERLRALGWAGVDVLSLFAGPPSLVASRLRAADVVLGYGGSNIWLAHAWTATGLASVLREVLEQQVYVGWSAGSMIFSRLHAAAVEALDDDEPALFELGRVAPALPLLDWFVLAHLGAPYFPHQTDEWAASTAARFRGPTWFLDDRSALLVRDPAGDPEVVSDGHWLRFDAGGRLVDSR